MAKVLFKTRRYDAENLANRQRRSAQNTFVTNLGAALPSSRPVA